MSNSKLEVEFTRKIQMFWEKKATKTSECTTQEEFLMKAMMRDRNIDGILFLVKATTNSNKQGIKSFNEVINKDY